MLRARVYNHNVVDLGELDPWQVSGEIAELLRELVRFSPNLEPGTHQAFLKNPDGGITQYSLRLRFPLTYRGELDPAAIDHERKSSLAGLLERVNIRGMCMAGLQCIRNPESQKIDLYDLKYTVIFRKKFSKTIYYDLLGSGIVGKGSFGTVRPIVGTIKPRFGNADDLYFSPSENKRVVKIMYDDLFSNTRQFRIEKEVRLMRTAEYFKVREKMDFVDQYDRIHVISMKRFPWVGLHRIIAMDNKNEIKLTIDDRLQLTIKMLRELKRQLHDKHIIHRDIKADNIHVNKDKITKFWEVNFIDLGLSTMAGDVGSDVVGTPYYLSPEIFAGVSQSEKSDLYALARAIGEVWRDTELKAKTDSNHSWGRFCHKRSTQKDINFRMFQGLDMPVSIRNEIEAAIRALSCFDHDSRPSLTQAINKFELIRLGYLLKDIDEKSAIKVRQAHQHAMTFVVKLDKYAREKITVTALAAMKADICCNIKLLPDHPAAIRVFVETLGIKCIYGIVNVDGLLSKTTDVFVRFEEVKLAYEARLSDLRAARDAIPCDSPQASKLNEYLILSDRFLYLINNELTLDLDAMVAMTKRIKAKTKDVSEAVTHYREAVGMIYNKP